MIVIDFFISYKKQIFHTRKKCSQKLIYTPVQIPFGIGDNASKQIEIKLMYILWNDGLNGVDGKFPICNKTVIFKKQIMYIIFKNFIIKNI